MTVRVSCGVAIGKASPELVNKIEDLGLQPIVTCVIIRAVYEGPDEALGRKIVGLFKREDTNDIYYDFGKGGRSDEETQLLDESRERPRKKSDDGVGRKRGKRRLQRNR